MPEGLQIVRAATVDDVPAIVAGYEWLNAPPGKTPAGWSRTRARDALLRALGRPDTAIFVATSNQELVGFATVYLEFESVRFGRRAWVEDLAVHPKHRSRGIGRRLLGEARDWARDGGAVNLGLESSEARTDAHRFYDRLSPSTRSRAYSWSLTE